MKFEGFGSLNGSTIFEILPFGVVVDFRFGRDNRASAAQLVFVLDGDHAMFEPLERFGMTVPRFQFSLVATTLGWCTDSGEG